jgi:acetyl-CoA carboxylase biotin carboxylase subunit
MAGECHAIGPAAPAASYLNQDALLDVVRRSGADGVHPGYGFLSENPGFAARVIAAGAGFIGPSPRWLEAMGHKTQARALMAAHGMPMGASSGILSGNWEEQLAAARAVGFPVLVKPATGGGGIGMLPAHSEGELAAALERAASLARRSFGNAELYLERLMQKPRHIEFQVLADRHGAVRHLFERDCSVQRRHQKVIEESPAPGIDRRALMETADRITGILATLGYDNIGTVETLYDPAAGFAFLEMNTRLQVEHAVTEEVTGIDLVQSQIRLAAGERLDQVLPAEIAPQGHAIEVRVYAEDSKRFLPSPGPLLVFRPPQGEGIRVETGYAEGNTVTPFYDPMLAKVVTRGATRQQAIARMREALEMFAIEGVKTNLAFARQVLDDEAFRAGAIHTGLTADVLARR